MASNSPAFNGINGRTLRFHSPDTEHAFAQSYGKHMYTNFFWISFAMVMLSIFSEGTYVFLDPMFSHPAMRSYTTCGIVIFFLTVGWSLLNMAMAKSGRMSRANPLVKEAIVVSYYVFLLFCIVVVNPHYWAALLGKSTEELYADANDGFMHSDSSVVMGLTSISSVSHLMPVRWGSLVVMEVSALLLYVVCWLFLGSPEVFNANYNAILVLVALTSQAVAKRASEYHARSNFVHYLHEKSLRFQSECQLSSLESSSMAPVWKKENASGEEADDDRNTTSEAQNQKASSGASDTVSESVANTGQLFSELRQELSSNDVEQSLEHIAGIGKREHWLIDEADVAIMWPKQTLGAGSFGVVAAATLHATPVAVKMPKETSTKRNPRFLSQLGNELRILRHVRHPNIVLFHGAVINFQHSELALVLELVSGPLLGDTLTQQDGWWAPLHDELRFQMALGVSRALRYLHALTPIVVHGDLKDSNILVEGVRSGVRPKLLDFGLARLLSVGARPLGGTLVWSAPELLTDALMPPDRSADVFSFGRLLYFIVTSQKPLADCTRKQVLSMAKSGSWPPLDWESGGLLGEAAKDIAEKCLSFTPGDRPTLIDVHDDISMWPEDGFLSKGGVESSHERSTDSSCSTKRLHEVIGAKSTVDEDQASWWVRKRRETEKKSKKPGQEGKPKSAGKRDIGLSNAAKETSAASPPTTGSPPTSGTSPRTSGTPLPSSSSGVPGPEASTESKGQKRIHLV